MRRHAIIIPNIKEKNIFFFYTFYFYYTFTRICDLFTEKIIFLFRNW